jgi:hypothetical protein
MGFLDSAKGIFNDFVNSFGANWWLEVTTTQPRCTYYFGPFDQAREAEAACPGYLEDLQQEGAAGIETAIKRCNPKLVTICEGAEE